MMDIALAKAPRFSKELNLDGERFSIYCAANYAHKLPPHTLIHVIQQPLNAYLGECGEAKIYITIEELQQIRDAIDEFIDWRKAHEKVNDD